MVTVGKPAKAMEWERDKEDMVRIGRGDEQAQTERGKAKHEEAGLT